MPIFLEEWCQRFPRKKHPYENFGMPYVFLWILHRVHRRNRCLEPVAFGQSEGFGFLHSPRGHFLRHLGFCKELCVFCKVLEGSGEGEMPKCVAEERLPPLSLRKNSKEDVGKVRGRSIRGQWFYGERKSTRCLSFKETCGDTVNKRELWCVLVATIRTNWVKWRCRENWFNLILIFGWGDFRKFNPLISKG